MDKDIPDNILHFMKCITNTHNIDLSYLKQLYTNCCKDRLTYDEINKKSLDELNKMCELRGIPKIGTKSSLIDKIISNTNPVTDLFLEKMSVLKNMCKEQKLKITGNKNELVLRLYYNKNSKQNNKEQVENSTEGVEDSVQNFIENISNINDKSYLITLNKDKLVNICREKNLNIIGSKASLIDRIINS